MLLEPRAREALLGPGQPGLRDEVPELAEVEARKIRDPHEHGRVAVEVRRREVEASRVGEQELLHAEIGDAEHEHVVEPVAGLRVDRVCPAVAVHAVELAVHAVGGPAVLGDLLRRLRHRHRQLVEAGHGRHGTAPYPRRAITSGYGGCGFRTGARKGVCGPNKPRHQRRRPYLPPTPTAGMKTSTRVA